LNFWFTRYQQVTDAWSIKMAASRTIRVGAAADIAQFYLGAPRSAADTQRGDQWR